MKIERIEAFQVQWSPADTPAQRSAFVRIWTDDGHHGIGEASPMMGGLASLGVIINDIAPTLIGADPLNHAVIQDRLMHGHLVKLGPDGALTGALAAIDIALWDLKGKLFNLPIYKLLGGAWRTDLPFYASIGGNGAERSRESALLGARVANDDGAVERVALAQHLREQEPRWARAEHDDRAHSFAC